MREERSEPICPNCPVCPPLMIQHRQARGEACTRQAAEKPGMVTTERGGKAWWQACARAQRRARRVLLTPRHETSHRGSAQQNAKLCSQPMGGRRGPRQQKEMPPTTSAARVVHPVVILPSFARRLCCIKQQGSAVSVVQNASAPVEGNS